MICPSCGAPSDSLIAYGGICPHHVPSDDDWSTRNRVMCDFVHRRIAPPPVTLDGWYEALDVA